MIKWLKKKFQFKKKKTVKIDLESYFSDKEFLKKFNPDEMAEFIQFMRMYKKSVNDLKHAKRMLLNSILKKINGGNNDIGRV